MLTPQERLQLTIPAKLRSASFAFACAAPQGVPFDEDEAMRFARKGWEAMGELEALSDARVPRWVKLALVCDRDTLDTETLLARSELCDLLARECERLEVL